MNVQAEGVVAPGDVLEALLDTPVVLGVDDRLLAVVGPWVGAGGAQSGALARGEREQAAAALALTGEGVSEVLAATGDDLYLRGDQLARDAPRPSSGSRLRAKSRNSSKRGTRSSVTGSSRRELLLDAHGEVGRLRERVNCLVEVQAGHFGRLGRAIWRDLLRVPPSLGSPGVRAGLG